MNQQIKTSLGLIIILIFAAIFGMFIWQMEENQPEIVQPVVTQSTKPSTGVTQTAQTNVTADWQTYRNDEYGFEFKYPNKKIKFTKLEEDEYMKDSKMKSYTMHLFPIDEEKAIEIENYAALKIYKNNSFDLQSYKSNLEMPENKGKFTSEELSSPTGNWECTTSETISLSLSADCVLQKGNDTFFFSSYFNTNLNKNFFSKEEFLNIVKSLKLN